MACFFSGKWLKMIFRVNKVKVEQKTPKQVKVNIARKGRRKGSRWRNLCSKISRALLVKGRGGVRRGTSIRAVHGRTVQDIAATRIQTAFRAYKARKGLRLMKGTVRFQASIENRSTEKQALDTLSHIHFWSNIQAQIRERRLYMVTEGRIKQKKVENQLKLEAKLHDLEVEWCGGSETMEEILARIQQREEAAAKRERAMAYAFSHQWRANSSQYFGQAYYDLGKESWGWSWKERWIAVRPWETRLRSPPSTTATKATKAALGKTANQLAIKILVSAKPTSNGRQTTTTTITRPIKLSQSSSAETEVLPEANGEG